jgi:DUF4097 and DUF4098 domain-containing protein YvlB
MDPRDYARAQKDYYRAWKQQQKDYYRANREQWRTQRDQWRDQRNVWYGRRRSLVGPIILIAIGVVLLLVKTGHMEAWAAWAWFGHWWPVILIAAGIGRLVEWMVDRNQPYPPRTSGFVGLLVVIVIVGMVATSSNHWNWHQFGDNFNISDDDDMAFLHGPEHDYSTVTEAVVPTGNSIEIIDTAHGDVSITTGEPGKVHIETSKKVYESDEQKARRDADAFKPVVTYAGNVTTIRVTAPNDSTRGNLQISLPASAVLTVSLQHGDLSVAGQTASVSANTHHGDLRFTDITGNVTVNADHGDFTASDIHGDLTLNGRYGDINVSSLTGRLTMDGDFPGDLDLRAVDGPLHFHSSRTDLDVARIADQLTINSGDLNGSNLAGPFLLKTHDYNVDLNNVSGEVNISNSDGDVNLLAAQPLGAITINNHSSGIRVTLPKDANFSVNMETKDGDISDDFGVCKFTSDGDHKVCNGTVGRGGPQITLNSNEGDISVRRGSDAVTVPPVPPVPVPPAPPAVPRKLTTRPASPKAPAPPAPEISNQ